MRLVSAGVEGLKKEKIERIWKDERVRSELK